MNKVNIYSITTNLSRYGGAQKVLIDLHNGLKNDYNCKIIGVQEFQSLHPKYQISESEYVRFKHPWQLKNAIVLVHARNVISPIIFMKLICCISSCKIIYISHNVYNSYKCLTFFPETIVSISNNVTNNLKSYFKIKENKNINLIHNGIKDKNQSNKLFYPENDSKIKILYPARVNATKRQIEIVRNLKNVLHKSIEIHFAGVGDDYELLKLECEDTQNFKVLGFVEDMDNLYKQYHYIMLYSFQEGLPIALIEGIMYGKPLLVNDVGGNFEIGIPNINAIELSSNWIELKNQLNNLHAIDIVNYIKMCNSSRNLYLSKFQYQTMIDKYKKLINSVYDK